MSLDDDSYTTPPCTPVPRTRSAPNLGLGLGIGINLESDGRKAKAQHINRVNDDEACCSLSSSSSSSSSSHLSFSYSSSAMSFSSSFSDEDEHSEADSDLVDLQAAPTSLCSAAHSHRFLGTDTPFCSPATMALASPPLMPLRFRQSFDGLEDDFAFSALKSQPRSAPSYSYALEHTDFNLLPSLPIAQCPPSTPITPPGSPGRETAFNVCTEYEGRKQEIQQQQQRGKKRRYSTTTSPSTSSSASAFSPSSRFPSAPCPGAHSTGTGASGNSGSGNGNGREKIRKLAQTSPALQHFSLFTHAAIAEDEGQQGLASMEMDELSDTMQGFQLRDPSAAATAAIGDAFAGQLASSFPSFTRVNGNGNGNGNDSLNDNCSIAPTPTALQQHVHSTIDQQLKCITTVDSLDTSRTSSTSGRHTPNASSKGGAKRRVDLTILVSNMPHDAAPYPPTPRSTALPPLTFSSTFPSPALASSPACPDFFNEALKQDIANKLGLGRIGLGLQHIGLFRTTTTTLAPEDPNGHDDFFSSSKSEKMTVVLHTC